MKLPHIPSSELRHSDKDSWKTDNDSTLNKFIESIKLINKGIEIQIDHAKTQKQDLFKELASFKKMTPIDRATNNNDYLHVDLSKMADSFKSNNLFYKKMLELPLIGSVLNNIQNRQIEKASDILHKKITQLTQTKIDNLVPQKKNIPNTTLLQSHFDKALEQLDKRENKETLFNKKKQQTNLKSQSISKGMSF